jgi:hypothetical protein
MPLEYKKAAQELSEAIHAKQYHKFEPLLEIIHKHGGQYASGAWCAVINLYRKQGLLD